MLLAIIPLVLLAVTSVASEFTPTVRWIDCTQNVPVPLQVAFNSTTWPPGAPTLDGLQCGLIDVPLDYEKSFGEDNKITVALSIFTPPNITPKGTIFLHPGGPDEGQSAVWTRIVNPAVFSDGMEDFELLAFDTRGTSKSTSLNCSPDLAAKIPLDLPRDRKAWDAYQVTVRDFAKSCHDNSTPPGAYQYVSTNEVIQDVENIRIALGKDLIHLYGGSYGAYVWPEYVQKYPDHVGRVILDASPWKGQPDNQTTPNEIIAGSFALQRVDAFCLQNSTCPFHNHGQRGGAIAAWKKATAIAKTGKLYANGKKITLGAMQWALRVYIQILGYPAIIDALQLVLSKNDGSGFLSIYPPANGLVQIVPFHCRDEAVDDPTFEGLQRLLAVPDKWEVGGLVRFRLMAICSAWPVPPRPKSTVSTETKFPAVFVASDYDFVCPIQMTFFRAAKATNASTVIRHGDHHTSLSVLGPSHAIMGAYLAHGTVIRSPNETLATVYYPEDKDKLGAIADPYAVGFGTLYGDV
ncbi:Alpha/Beta hydrolase protein [Flagelloscypha sp. PMI_526]|nr:Alpha/Beta hydrolase protein [Flagelloscypha sp. PMI_526]